jgi:hypothetical protein
VWGPEAGLSIVYALRQVFELSKKYLRGFGQSFDLVTGNHDLEVGHMFDAFGRIFDMFGNIFDMFPRPRTRHLRFSLPAVLRGLIAFCGPVDGRASD